MFKFSTIFKISLHYIYEHILYFDSWQTRCCITAKVHFKIIVYILGGMRGKRYKMLDSDINLKIWALISGSDGIQRMIRGTFLSQN